MAKKDTSTKSFILRIDASTMEAVEQWAADEFRSTNGQLQWIIAEALRKSGRLKQSKKSSLTPKEETHD
ncbi:MAG: DNA-binding protein [Bacteroides sp.]|nr:DNA-binding protein [Bacteroides sp.]MBQ8225188.1 DNA-binding protein [Bacteroides sp.]